MRAKQYLTVSLAVVMMTGISATGCRAPQRTEMWKTEVAPEVAGKAMQMWRCELEDDATEEQVMKGAQEWLAAARTMKGGENLDFYVHFPVVVNATGQIDVVLMLVAPSFQEWGEFWDGYGDSPAANVEEATKEFIICPDSTMWQSTKVNTTAETPPRNKTSVAPAVAGKAMQMWRCELEDDATEEQVMKGAQEWLAAARMMDGGEDLDLYVNFPVVVNATGQIDVVLMLVAPSFEEWGEFWDGYGDSPAANVEEATKEFIICPDSVLWASSKVETP